MIQGTSLLAYIEVLENIGQRQMQVYQTIEDQGALSNTMISEILHLPINCITGRTYELRKQGLISISHKGKCPITNKFVIFWKVRHKLK